VRGAPGEAQATPSALGEAQATARTQATAKGPGRGAPGDPERPGRTALNHAGVMTVIPLQTSWQIPWNPG
jgi:hypothetical protein